MAPVKHPRGRVADIARLPDEPPVEIVYGEGVRRALAKMEHVVVLAAGAGETVRAEPFDAVELELGPLFGDEELAG